MRKIKHFLWDYKISFFVMCIFLMGCMKGTYQMNLTFLLRQITYLTFLTIGASIEMMSGDFDLAFAAQISASTVTAAYLITLGVPIWAACGAIVVLNALLGCLKGILLTRYRMPSIIVTLALQVILLNLFSGIFPEDKINFLKIYRYFGSGVMEYVFGGLLILSVLGVFFFLNYTYYGKYCRMLGENMVLAEKSGLNIQAVSMIIHMASSLFFSIPAIGIMLYTGSGNSYMGANYLYKVLAAVCLGGIGYRNGKGKVSGMVIGAVTMVVLLMMLTSGGYLKRFEIIIEGIIILFFLGTGKKVKT
ncbi:MAG TPA: ABC transporter permease [Candidatus Pelethocola excrementipullorum]|nr:ABC transporter permease [Candidatus Pelethocola excrementipullorum]